MNLFLLSRDPRACARMYNNPHVVKMILELCQLLCVAHWMKGDLDMLPEAFYRPTHERHPVSIWVRQCEANYQFTVDLALALCDEYYERYGYKRQRHHKCRTLLLWLSRHRPDFAKPDQLPPPRKKSRTQPTVYATESLPPGCSPFPLCMPEDCHHRDVIIAYRNCYLIHKRHLGKWPVGRVPDWWPFPNLVTDASAQTADNNPPLEWPRHPPFELEKPSLPLVSPPTSLEDVSR